jgi:hypothetical protein
VEKSRQPVVVRQQPLRDIDDQHSDVGGVNR